MTRHRRTTGMKRYTTAGALIIVLLLFSTSSCCRAPHPVSALQGKAIVYYFHRTVRCPSCILIETLTSIAIQSGFDRDVQDTRIDYQVVNLDEPQNAHYVREYGLTAQAVVICSVLDGRKTGCRTMDQVWELLHDEPKFIEYIQDGITQSLNSMGQASLD